MLKTSIKNLPQMEIIAHQYLTKLRIISKIPENGQLDLTNNDLNIYNPTILNWVYRKLQGDGKLNTVTYLRSFYREVNGFTTDLMKSIDVEQNELNKSRKIILLTSLAEKIKESTIGVDNLVKTYRHYHKIISTLESIQQDIIENQLKNIIMFVPEKFKTEVLKDIENGQYDMVVSDSISERNISTSPGRDMSPMFTPDRNSPSQPIPIPESYPSPKLNLNAHSMPDVEFTTTPDSKNKKKSKRNK